MHEHYGAEPPHRPRPQLPFQSFPFVRSVSVIRSFEFSLSRVGNGSNKEIKKCYCITNQSFIVPTIYPDFQTLPHLQAILLMVLILTRFKIIWIGRAASYVSPLCSERFNSWSVFFSRRIPGGQSTHFLIRSMIFKTNSTLIVGCSSQAGVCYFQ